jgi:hypothetical protein
MLFQFDCSIIRLKNIKVQYVNNNELKDVTKIYIKRCI